MIMHTPIFPRLLTTAMEGKGFDINELAKLLDVTYEHTRRLVRGESLPSKPLLKTICAVLDIDESEAKQHVHVDQMNKRYGYDFAIAMPREKPPESNGSETVVRLWDRLNADQRGDLICLAERWARRNRTEANEVSSKRTV